MTREMIIEGIGYFGSALVVVSMLMTSVKWLRIVNSIGSAIFAGYAIMIHSYPTAIMNIVLLVINIYNLVKLHKESKNYNVIECMKSESIVQLYLKSNLEDIRKFFPGYDVDTCEASSADSYEKTIRGYLVCAGSMPVGIMTGIRENETTFAIELDYSIPSYRDCSVGTYLLGYLKAQQGICEVVFRNPSEGHVGYLDRVGYVKSEDGYRKTL